MDTNKDNALVEKNLDNIMKINLIKIVDFEKNNKKEAEKFTKCCFKLLSCGKKN